MVSVSGVGVVTKCSSEVFGSPRVAHWDAKAQQGQLSRRAQPSLLRTIAGSEDFSRQGWHQKRPGVPYG